MRFLLLIFLLTSCATGGSNYKTYLAKKGITSIAPESFNHCRGYGCRIIDSTALTSTNWQELELLFENTPDAKTERQKIAKAIGVIEQKIGAYTGTEVDIAGTYVKLGNYQHDCVDESLNTTIYLSILKERNLIRFHDIGTPSARIPPFSRGIGPHQSAVITDIATNTRYAVDSWFHDNGQDAEIVTMKKWFFGWRPD